MAYTRICMGRRSAMPSMAVCMTCLTTVLAIAFWAAAEGSLDRVPPELRQPEVKDLKPLFCEVTRVPADYHNRESGYTAFDMGPDGRVYIGTAYYYDYGYWLAYDPQTNQITEAVDLRKAIPDYLYDINTQGKTHSYLKPGPDGRVYGATKQGHELFSARPEIGEESRGYPGGALLAYDPATGVTEYLGVLRSQDGVVNGVVDMARRRIYFKTEPRTHFLIYEIDTRQVLDKGRVGTWTRYIDMDEKGNVWIPNYAGRVTMYDVDRDELRELTVRPEQGSEYKTPYACIIGGKQGGRNRKLYGGDFTRIQEFDLAAASETEVPMRQVCRAVPEPYEKAQDIHAMERDAKGRIYWFSEVKGEPNQLLIMRYDPDRGEGECLGYVVDEGLARLREHVDSYGKPAQNHTNIQGAAFGADGTLFLMATYPYYILEFPQLAAD